MTETPKLTKRYLMGLMRQQLKDRTFNRDQFKTQYGILDRQARRYMNEIASEFSQISVSDLILLKQYCIQNLTEKAQNRELDESTETKIALAGTALIEVNLNAQVDIQNQVNQLIKISREPVCSNSESTA